MVQRFFRTLLSGTEPAPTAEGAPRPKRVGSDPRPVDATGDPLARRADDAAALRVWLEEEARASVNALQYAFAPEGRTNDSQRLVESFQESLSGLEHNPSESALEALSLTRDPEAPIGRLIELVRKDRTLEQSLLRYARTPYYAANGGPCASLPAAVQRIGPGGVRHVVLKSVLDGLMSRPGGWCQDIAEKSWSHMIRTAPIARAIAPAFQVAADDAYSVGLFHDAGKMVVLNRVTSLRMQMRRDLLIPYSTLRALLRMLHEDFGGLAALQWGLGAKIAHAVATHHRAPVPHVRNSLGEVLFLAERCDLMAQQGKGIDLDALWRDGSLSGSRSTIDLLFASRPAGFLLPESCGETPSPKEVDAKNLTRPRRA